LSLAVCYGQGSKEFLRLECETFRRSIDEARDKNLDFMMWIGEARDKTSIQPRSFLTPETIESVDEYLDLLEKKHGRLPKFLWCNSKTDKHITNEGLNKKLRRLVEKANIKTYGKKVHFHLIRKFTFSRLRRIDKDMAKIICAKKVSASDMTYEEVNEQCEKVFRLAYKDISLNGDVTGQVKRKQLERIEELENVMNQLEQENLNFKIRIDLLQKNQKENGEQVVELKKENERINDLIELLYPKQVIRNILNQDEKIVSWEETFNTPEEYIESEREFRRMIAKAQNRQRDEEFQEYVKNKNALIEDFLEHTERKQKQAKK